MSRVVGIDLGTTNSVVAFIEGGEATIIPNAEGNRTTPSVVAFTRDGERLVGQVAKRQAVTNAERTITSIKRKMGTDHKVRIDDRDYTPQEISGMVLAKLKRDAEEYLGQEVTRAVVTVPAYFSDSQRQATKDAGAIAGLEVLRIINEPTAAALAYGLERDQSEKIMVFDLGGGTFDVSILELGDEVVEVIATSGDNLLGGDDFDERIVEYLVAEFKKEYGVDLGQDRMAMQRLNEAAEKAKVELSGLTTSNVNLPFITADASGPKHLDITLTRARFEELTRDLVERTMGPARTALKDSGLDPAAIDRVILVGGATRMPMVQEAVRELMGKDPYKGINPDEVVAMGAAIQAGIIAGDVKDVVLLDVTPLSLGIETLGGVFTRLIEKNTTIPTSEKQTFSTAADGQTQVDIHVLQGERPQASQNKTLGRFILDGIPPAPRGVPKIEVTFDIDVNGIVNVSAHDLGTGRQQKITITASSGLSEEELKQMVEDAEKHAEEDRQFKELAEARNSADSLVYNAEKTVKDLGDKADSGQVEAVNAAVTATREALEGDDLEAIKAASEQLAQAVYTMSAAVYEAEAAQEAEAGAEGADDPDPEVVDTEDFDVK